MGNGLGFVVREGLRQAQTDNRFIDWVWWFAGVFDPSLLLSQGKLSLGLRQAQTDSGIIDWVSL
jgi:hypothetical protein